MLTVSVSYECNVHLICLTFYLYELLLNLSVLIMDDLNNGTLDSLYLINIASLERHSRGDLRLISLL